MASPQTLPPLGPPPILPVQGTTPPGVNYGVAGGPPALYLGYSPGLVDLPDSIFTAGNVFGDLLLARLRSNADWNATCCELFLALAYDGDTVSLPVSPVTGYQYQPSEVFMDCTFASSLPPSGIPSASGQLIFQNCNIDPSYKVSVSTAYYLPASGGSSASSSLTNDGLLIVWVIGLRGWGQVSLSSIPGFTDVADSNFAQDQPITPTVMQQLNQNCKLPRREVFLNQAAPILSISRGGNLVVATTKTPHGLLSGDPIYVLQVNDPTFNSSASTVLPGGYGVSALAYTVLTVPSPTTLTYQQQNGANANSAGGRIQKAFFKNGDTVAQPVSPVDSYQYTRGSSDTLLYIPLLRYTGNPSGGGPSGAGRIRRLGPFTINPSTGVFSSNVEYYDGSVSTSSNDGRHSMVVLAMRGLAGSPPMSQEHVHYNGYDESYYLSQELLGDTILTGLNQDAKEALGRPEFFMFAGGNATQIGVPTSPLDNSTYYRGQCLWLWALEDSSDAGTSCLTSYLTNVTPNVLIWAPNFNFEAGTLIVDLYGYYRTVSISGISGPTVPNWDIPWTASTNYPSSGLGVGGTQGQIIIDSNGNQQICTTAGTSGTSQPVWGTTHGAITHDNVGGGTAVWTFIQAGSFLNDSSVVWYYSGVATNGAGTITGLINGFTSGPTVQGVTVGSRS